MTEVGEQLRRARLGRGLTLDQVEREIYVSARYLEALERDEREALPAPVYARGFLRSYARYLGLDPDTLAQRFDRTVRASSALVPPLPGPLEDDEARATPGLLLWLFGGGVALILGIAFVFGIAALREDDGGTSTAVAQVGTEAGGQVLPVATPVPDGQPRTIAAPAIEPPEGRSMPDFRERDLASAVAVLIDLNVPYVVVETYSGRAPDGRIIQQTPRPGARVDENTSVTLVVSRGTPEADATETP